MFCCTSDENLALLIHFFFDLFSHRTAQNIGCTKRVIGKYTRRLLHLFLIDHNAIGFGQNRFEIGMHIGDL